MFVVNRRMDDRKILFFFFFKQKTAYEIGTGDWSSDVCSSDLLIHSQNSSTQTLLILIMTLAGSTFY